MVHHLLLKVLCSLCRISRSGRISGCEVTPHLVYPNHSFEMVRRSKQCVINIPTTDLINEAIGIGNCSGRTVEKFPEFGLTPVPAQKVEAPLIKECYANFECKLANSSMIEKWGLFIWEVVKAHVATSPKYPETFHYRGDGIFMISGRSINLSRKFKPEML